MTTDRRDYIRRVMEIKGYSYETAWRMAYPETQEEQDSTGVLINAIGIKDG